MLKKDISVQCSLLPAPPLSFGRTFDSSPEVDTDLETDEIMTEVEDSDTEVEGSDTDYMTDVADTAER